MVPRPASVDRGCRARGITEGVVHRSAHLTREACMAPVRIVCKQAISSAPSWEASQRRMATFPVVPETSTTNRPVATRRAAVALDNSTARWQKTMAVTTAQPGWCGCGHLYSARGAASTYYGPDGNLSFARTSSDPLGAIRSPGPRRKPCPRWNDRGFPGGRPVANLPDSRLMSESRQTRSERRPVNRGSRGGCA